MQLEVKTRESPQFVHVPATHSETRARLRVLHFAPRVCWPLDTGAKLRNFHLARVLAERASVTLLAFADSEPHDDAPGFYDRVITVTRESGYGFSKIVRGAFGRTPLPILNYTTAAMKQALTRVLTESDFDLVQIESIHLMDYLPIIRAARNSPKVICDWHNVESELMQRYSEREKNPLRRAYAHRTARKMGEFERRAMTEFDAHVAVSERDAQQLRRVNPNARIFVIENGVDVAHYSGRQAEIARTRILFVGSMDYHANCDAVVDFAREVWPLVRESRPELVFTIVGRDPSPAVRELASLPGVEVTGTVDDVRPFYREAVAALVPLKTGGGSRLKILEAMAASVPVISTRLGAEGIDVKDRENVLLAETANEFHDAITEIIDNHELREKLLATGRALVRERYDWSTLGANLSQVHAGLITRRPVLAVSSQKTSPRQAVKTIKLLAIVEATTVNAVARNMLEFHRAAIGVQNGSPDFPRVELSLVTFARGSQIDTPNEFVTAAHAQGLSVDVIPERGRFDSSVIPALRRIAENHQPDIVLTHSVKSHFLLWRSQLWKKIPWIAFHHGYTTTDRKMRLYNQMDRFSLPHASRVMTVCAAFAQELTRKSVPRDRISVLHNAVRIQPAVSMEQSTTLRQQLGIKSDQRIILAVGRLSREKAHIDLIHAFSHLCQTNPRLDARLVIVGDGPERAQLESATKSLGLADKTIFAGHSSDVQPYYAIADVLANSSHSEGSPYVLLEAMAARLPIVATAVGGVPEMLEDKRTGLLVPSRDPEALAHALALLLSDPALAERLANSATELVGTRFSPEGYARSLIDIYSDITSQA